MKYKAYNTKGLHKKNRALARETVANNAECIIRKKFVLASTSSPLAWKT
jgi:hypothetical protein